MKETLMKGIQRYLTRLAAIALFVFLPMNAKAQSTSNGKLRNPFERIVPKQQPEFRKTLSDTSFQAKAGSLHPRLTELMATKDTKTPFTGLRVGRVIDGTMAAEVGLNIGAVVFQVDNGLIWSEDVPKKKAPRQLQFYSQRNNRIRTVRIKPGSVGFSARYQWKPELQYLQSKMRNSKWDRDVLIGITAAKSDPALAETAWNRAIRAGYQPDWMSAMWGAVIALESNRPITAAKFAHFATMAAARDNAPVHPQVLLRVAAACCDWQQVITLAELYPHSIPFQTSYLQRWVSYFRNQPTDYRLDERVTDRSQRMFRDNLLVRAADLSFPKFGNEWTAFRQNKTVNLKVPTAHYRYVRFSSSEPCPNVEMKVRFSAKVTDSNTNEFVKESRFSLFMGKYAENRIFSINDSLEFAIRQDSQLTVHFNNVFGLRFIDKRINLDGQTEHEVRLVRVDNRCEILLNGVCILCVPARRQMLNHTFNIKTVGMTLKVHDFEAHELIEQP